MPRLIGIALLSALAACEKHQAPPLPGQVGSAGFHLDLGGVYQRYGDARGAAEHFTQAAALAQEPGQRMMALSSLAAAQESAGDEKAAIASLEKALALTQEAKAVGLAQAAAIRIALARLEAKAGKLDRVRELCDQGIESAADSWQRDEVARVEAQIFRERGTLGAEVALRREGIAKGQVTEASLRFLSAALRDGADAVEMVDVQKRLVALHPDEPQLRQRLQDLLVRMGRTDEAVKMAGAPAQLTAMDCEGLFATRPVSPGLRAIAEAARIRIRAGQEKEAQAEIARITTASKEEGTAATLLAAQLYVEQGSAALALQSLARASQEARLREEQREVAVARERALRQLGDAEKAQALVDQWKSSDDACLRYAASLRGPGVVAARP